MGDYYVRKKMMSDSNSSDNTIIISSRGKGDSRSNRDKGAGKGKSHGPASPSRHRSRRSRSSYPSKVELRPARARRPHSRFSRRPSSRRSRPGERREWSPSMPPQESTLLAWSELTVEGTPMLISTQKGEFVPVQVYPACFWCKDQQLPAQRQTHATAFCGQCGRWTCNSCLRNDKHMRHHSSLPLRI